jgi:hypothetical protein
MIQRNSTSQMPINLTMMINIIRAAEALLPTKCNPHHERQNIYSSCLAAIIF